MKSLIIYNTIKKFKVNQDWLKENGYILWETCVRQIVIGDVSDDDYFKGWEKYTGDKAYQFLLEVICGFHSPMQGETEVFCQFKKFVANKPQSFQLWQDLIKDTKYIRSHYLKGYGKQSYGGVIKDLAHRYNETDIIGSGDLVASILPHLTRYNGKVNILCRNQQSAKKLCKENPFNVHSLNYINIGLQAMLVIAAPVETNWIIGFIEKARTPPKLIVDLRSSQDHECIKFDKKIPILSLEEVFSRVQDSKNKIQKNITAAQTEIERRSRDWCDRTQYRPFGWEDICVS